MKSKILLLLLLVFSLISCGEEAVSDEMKNDRIADIRLLQEELKLCQMNSIDLNISKNNSHLEKNNYEMLVKVCLFAALSCNENKNKCLNKFEKCISADIKNKRR